MSAKNRKRATQKEVILTKATPRSADFLRIDRKDLSEIIGISEATISRMYKGESVVSLGTKAGETATHFVRIYRSLDSLFRGKPDLCLKWLKATNSHLGGIPLELTKTIQGLVEVARYLDGMANCRGPESSNDQIAHLQ